ncbi:chlorohydrolase family protein [Lederbergia panacisoli]|uniref:chlorohydrolase family protein n=1 Tax=Lederbergia panacisoli TaxID=1255251 RepID=UPI00214B2127|nr:chlorohydrolase family protein [Lederbergia panacisoli]MCR2823295.1 chlorohydrolase family protein [Lederbergia panacisoli]
MKTKLTGAYVIGHDGDDHVIYKNGEVVFEGNTIEYVGKSYEGNVDREIAAGNAIVSPGFIDLDALVDIDHGILDVAIPRNPKLRFSRDMSKFRTSDLFTRKEHQIKQRLSFAQLIMNGITTGMPIAGDGFRAWAETYEEMSDGANIAYELGIRMYLGPSYRMAPYPLGDIDQYRGSKSVEDAFLFAEKFDNTFESLIRTFLSPCQLMNQTEQVLLDTKSFSDRTGVPIRLHCCEDPKEVEFLREKYDMTPIEYLESIGFLGKKTLIPHAIFTGSMIPNGFPKKNELTLLAQSGTSVVHTPIAESHGGQALYSFSHYLQAGVNMTIGTDTHPADMIQNLNFAWNLNRIFERGEIFNPYGGPRSTVTRKTTEADLFRAATTNAAKAIGRDDLGKLSPGAKADIIVIDLNSLRTIPVEDPIRTLIMNTTGSNVRDCFINGKVVMRNGCIPGLDVDGLRREAQKCFDKYKDNYSYHDKEQKDVDTLFPPAFRMIK